MKWSWKLATLRGVDVRVHATFLILIGFVAWSHFRQGQTAAQVVEAVAFVLALFACVVVHELGHAAAAARYGIRTRDITLLPIGGVARLERMPEQPKQELWVALAGPLTNVVIAAVLAVVLVLTRELQPLEQLSVVSGPFLERLMVVNAFLAVFNLLPAFPMDGGRVLRALLSTRVPYARATQIAATIGQGMALLLGFLGFIYNPFLMFIALFVWIGAAQEAGLAQIKAALAGIPVSHAMLTRFRTLSPDDSLREAVALILSGSQTDFPVVDQGHVVGMLTRSDLILGLARHNENVPVHRMMRTCKFVHPDEMLEPIFRKLQELDCKTLPVMNQHGLVGLITMENLGEFVAIQSARTSRAREEHVEPVRQGARA